MNSGGVSSRYFVLGLLNQRPMSGYDIRRFLKGLSWLIGSPSFGSLYPTLHALLRDGLVTVDVVPCEGKPARKIYTITEAGRQTLQEWIDQPVAPDAPMKAFVMRLILVGNHSPTGLVAHLRQRRSQVAGQHAALEQIAGSGDGETDPGEHLALEYGLALAAAEITWLDRALEQLSQQPPSAEVTEAKARLT